MSANRNVRGILLAAALLLSACGPAAGAGGPAPSAPPGGAVIVASGTAFDRNEIDVPADVSFTLLFDNRDGVPHNVTVVDPAGMAVFVGDTFSGPSSREYALPALAAGRYRFRCDVHVDMSGDLIAGA